MSMETSSSSGYSQDSLVRKSSEINPNVSPRHAHNHRFLEDNYYSSEIPDLSEYSLKFEKCQSIVQYNENHNNNDILSTKRFVIFRLCPTENSMSCSSSGEYLVDLSTYLSTTVDYLESKQQQYCDDCFTCMHDDDANANNCNMDIDTCYTKCNNIANLETNGYVDAGLYTKCGKVYYNQNTGVSYYAGAMCSSGGSKIKIGLFSDVHCNNPVDSNIAIDRYIKNEKGYNVKLSYHLLKQTFEAGEFITDCADDNNTVCESLYQEAGKCEASNGFDNGMYSNAEDYAVQINNEEMVCDFIQEIRAGHYNQNGEIELSGMVTVMGIKELSEGQMFALAFLSVGLVGLVMYAVHLRRQIGVKQRRLNGMEEV